MNKPHNPTLKLYHPNAKGTGSALSIECVPAHNDKSGYFGFVIYPQNPTNENLTFNAESAVGFALDFLGASQLLQVLRGEVESLNEGKGICLESKSCAVRVTFRHQVEPYGCYVLEVFAIKKDDSKEERHGIFTFSNAEACGICEVLASTLHIITFGTGFEATALMMERDEEEAKNAAEAQNPSAASDK